jgi:uncharacterized protein YndB with AHSA1/START domain
MAEERQVRCQVVVNTTPELAFEAVTAASELREWFSDEARTEVQPGGRYEVRWQRGYRAEGRFTSVEAPRKAAFTWQGTGEPGETEVEVTVEPAGSRVAVAVVHGKFGSGEAWEQAMAEAKKGWTTGLGNLQSTLETGVDLRIARRPFIGILPGQLDADRIAREGIAVSEGIYLAGTVQGSAAAAAGLRQGDVIVSLGGEETPGFAELGAALRARQIGDVVELGLVRGQKREKVVLTLGSRPHADVGGTANGLAQLAARGYAETDAELKAALEGVSEQEAEACPAEGEWSVKQLLAHLILSERDGQSFLANVAVSGWLDGGDGNPVAIPGRLAAVIGCLPTLPALVGRYFDYEAETVAFLQGLPAETLAHRARFRRMCDNAVFGPIHTRDHIKQIRNAVQAVRGR